MCPYPWSLQALGTSMTTLLSLTGGSWDKLHKALQVPVMYQESLGAISLCFTFQNWLSCKDIKELYKHWWLKPHRPLRGEWMSSPSFSWVEHEVQRDHAPNSICHYSGVNPKWPQPSQAFHLDLHHYIQRPAFGTKIMCIQGKAVLYKDTWAISAGMVRRAGSSIAVSTMLHPD